MIPIPIPNKKIVQEHCNNVIDYITNHTYDGANTLITINFALNKVQKGLTLDRLVKLKPKALSKIVPLYDNYKNTILNTLLKKELTKNDCPDYETKNIEIQYYNSLISFSKMEYFYHEFEQKYGLDLMEKTKVKVCPYCNRYEIFNGINHKTSQFDHFIPKGVKTKYPIFALCYFNLIPACSNCNHIKTSNDISIISPYDTSLKNDSFYFYCTIKQNIDEISVKLHSKSNNIKFVNGANGLNDNLELEKFYSESQIVKDKFFKIKNDVEDIKYNNYLDLLLKEYNIKTKRNKISFTKFLLDDYEKDSDFLVYPYSKITKDIAEQFHLFDLIKHI